MVVCACASCVSSAKEFWILSLCHSGTPPLSATVEVPVHVVDTSSPVFETQQKGVRILENTPLHSAVVSVQAASPKGHKLLYSIVQGDRYGDFQVDFNTGKA